MKAHVMFDTLAYANKLKAAGADPKLAEVQAEANAEMVASLIEGTLATKQDIADLRTELKQDISDVRQEMVSLEARLLHKMAELETRLTLRLGGIMIGTVTVATAILSIGRFAH